ncbi:MAG: secretin N-terminal domain-containing protein [Planctomycetota bacterium]
MTNRIKVSKTGFFRVIFVLSFFISIFNNWLLAEDNSPSAFPRYRVFSLKHIPAENGKTVLEQMGIGTVSQLPNSNTLLVTAEGKELIKASSILELIDSEPKYVIEMISSASETNDLPTSEQLEKELGPDVSIGTFDNPPSNLVSQRILIDTHNDMVLLIAREEFSENILNAIDRFSRSEQKGEIITEPNASPLFAETDQAKENDEFFKKLLDSLDEAEQKASELQIVSQPSDEIKGKIIKLQKEKLDKTMPGVSAVIERETEGKAAVEQMDADTEGLTELLSSLSQASSVSEPSKPSTQTILTGGEDKTQQKSGVIPLTEKRPTEQQEIIQVDENLYRPEFSVGTKEELKINLPSKLNITDLLSLVGEYLELDFMYDPAKVKGEVMLKFRGPIRVKDLYPLMESVLKFHGFVMTRNESLVTIVPVAEALNYDPEIYSEPGSVKVGDVVITRIFKLQHVDTASAKNLLSRMKLGVTSEEIPATKTLIITEYAYRMPRIEELIKMIDQPGKPKMFRYRRLEYTLATSLVTQVKNLADKLGTVSVTVAAPAKKAATKQPTSRAQRPTPQRPATQKPDKPAAAAKPVDTSVYLVADERTNRILMIGLEEDLNVIEDIISALDLEKQDLRTLRLYEIQNVGAEDVANKLRDLGIISVLPTSGARGRTQTSRGRGRITSTAPRSTPTAQRPAGTAQPQLQTTDAASVEEILTGEPQVVIIESTNSLLINGTAEQHAQIALIIGYVDSQTERASIPYVVYPLENQDPTELSQILTQLITETTQTQDQEGKIVSSTTTKLLEDDIVIIPDPMTYSLIVYASKKNQQWISNIIKQLDEYRAQVLLDVTLVAITKDDDFQYSLDILTKYPSISEVDDIVGSTVALGGRFWEASSLGGTGEFFYNDDHVQALLTAVSNRNWGRVLSRPKLLVNDNQEGNIVQNRTIYITETNVITTATTTTPTTSTDVKFIPYKTGIDLTIKPHISKGNQLRLEITLLRDDFDGEPTTLELGQNVTVQKPANERSNQIKSVVTVPDGYTVILGGIETIGQQKAGSKVPILGDIPLIGGLFNSINNKDEQSRLYIFVKAHILRPSENVDDNTDIVRVSKQNQVEFEKLEKKFQEAQDWPGIKPEPLDPVKVLEEIDLR